TCGGLGIGRAARVSGLVSESNQGAHAPRSPHELFAPLSPFFSLLGWANTSCGQAGLAVGLGAVRKYTTSRLISQCFSICGACPQSATSRKWPCGRSRAATAATFGSQI